MRTNGKGKKRVAIIGYGSQGRAWALNLRDSGLAVTVGLRVRSKSRKLAAQDGFRELATIPSAVQAAGIIVMAFPDHLHGSVFRKEIAPFLSHGSTLVFLHGTSVHFGYVKPPQDSDIIMIAPHAPGSAVREKYLGDRSISAFYAVVQNASGHATHTAFALASALRIDRRRLMRTTFADESVGDLFGEQAVLCGGLSQLIRTGYDLLVEEGIHPEHAYLEVAYQLDLIIALIKQHGIQGMLQRISVAARYGSVMAGPKIINASVKASMRRTLDDITSGRFARRLNRLDKNSMAKLSRDVMKMSGPSFEKAARKLGRR